MTDLKYYIVDTIGNVVITLNNKAIYFDTIEEAQFFFDNYLTSEDKEMVTIVYCILFYDGGYINWKKYKKEFKWEEYYDCP